ncbi:MAG: dethiobiotin synthase [Gallionellaceae bacterium]|nr:dethiobiotin synthase [Gallionellaceae bacterium]
MSYFITGTDTGVGKTLVSCALLHAFSAQGKRVVGFKPVAAGCDEHDHNEDALQLRAASNVLATYGQINPYCFVPPIAPHIAARNSGVHIEMARILTSFNELKAQADEIIVEGVGGFLVPLNEKEDTAMLAQHMALPVILVVGVRLGCLNHALLTLKVIESYQLECVGWVANVLDENMPALQQNIDTLSDRLEAPLLGVIPFQVKPDARVVATCLNINLLLQQQELHE